MKIRTKIFVLFTSVYCFGGVYAQAAKISRSISIAGDDGWDYMAVDEPAQHLFVSHGTVVNVVDLNSAKTIATIPDTKGVHGIAIANELNKAFITNGKEDSVTIVDLKTFAIIDKIRISGVRPDAVLYDKFSQRVFVYNAKTNDCTVIDALTHKVTATIPLGGKPEFSATDGKGRIFVNVEDKSQIKVVDAHTLKVVHTWTLAPGEEPSGLAFDVENERLFSVCSNNLMIVVNAKNGKVVTTLPIGDGCDGVAFDPKTHRIFSSNGEGNITVVQQNDKDSYKVVQKLQTQRGARTIALNKTTHQLYTPTAVFGKAPEPTADIPHPRPAMAPGSFKVIVIDQL